MNDKIMGCIVKNASRKEIDDTVASMTPWDSSRDRGEWKLNTLSGDGVPGRERACAFQAAQAAADSVAARDNRYETSISVHVAESGSSGAIEYMDEDDAPMEAPATFRADLLMRDLPGWYESVTAEKNFLACLTQSVGREVFADIVKFECGSLFVRVLFRAAKESDEPEDPQVRSEQWLRKWIPGKCASQWRWPLLSCLRCTRWRSSERPHSPWPRA